MSFPLNKFHYKSNIVISFKYLHLMHNKCINSYTVSVFFVGFILYFLFLDGLI